MLEISAEIMPLLLSHSNPTIYILAILEQKQKNITIKDFQIMMEQISRWDILDDTEDMLGISKTFYIYFLLFIKIGNSV